MSEREIITLCELDYDFCRLRYGETNDFGTCSAALGTTGEAKCFNTRATCQDPDNYTRGTKVLRFMMPSGVLSASTRAKLEAIPNIASVSTAPARIRPGEDLGERASVSVQLKDHTYHDRTVDKYAEERVSGAAQTDGVGYKPSERGTYWGKWRARNPFFQNRELRIYQGTAEDADTTQGPWGIRKTQYDGTNLDITTAESDAPGGLKIRPGGSDIYVRSLPSDEIGQFNLPEAYDLLSASFYGSLNVSTEVGGNGPIGFDFRRDNGDKLYVLDTNGGLFQYSLSTSWNVTTATYDSVSINIASNIPGEEADIRFKDDGTEFYVLDQASNVSVFTLGTAWDINTTSFSASYDVSTDGLSIPLSFDFGDNGTILCIVDNTSTNANIYYFSLQNPWDFSLFYLSHRVNTESETGGTSFGPTGIDFADNGQYVYVLGRPGGYEVLRYSIIKSLPDFEARHYVMESIDGPTSNGSFTITAKDILKLADDDRAQAPSASQGALNADITDSATSATLSPSGIGDAEYPASGFVTIENEIIGFTRSGDTLTLTRAQYGTAAEAHGEGDTVQLAIEYDGVKASAIVEDLLVNYANVSSGFIDSAAWTNEDDTHINRLFTAIIVEPESVRELIGQLCEQVGFTVWWNEIDQLVEFRAIRQPGTPPLQLTDREHFLQGSMKVKEQQKKRISQVWVYYGVIDPTEDLEEARNYRSVYVDIDTDAQSDNEYQKPKIKKVFARWIDRFNRPAAEDVATRILSRYRDAPRKFDFSLKWDQEGVSLGNVYDAHTRLMQTFEGAPDDRRIIVTSYERGEDRVNVESEEFLYTPDPDDGIHRVPIDQDTLQQFNGDPFNLREAHDRIYTSISDTDTVELIIAANAILGSNDPSAPACDIGDWPSGTTVKVIVNGRIQGCAGKGGAGGDGDNSNGTNGSGGGIALYTRRAIELDNQGEVWGGAGGGGGGAADLLPATNPGGGGGGGAGFAVGIGGKGGKSGFGDANDGSNGTTDAGGSGGSGFDDGGNGGAGGDPAQAGSGGQNTPDGSGGSGGSAGSAIDGNSHITYTTTGDIRGAQVN